MMLIKQGLERSAVIHWLMKSSQGLNGSPGSKQKTDVWRNALLSLLCHEALHRIDLVLVDCENW